MTDSITKEGALLAFCSGALVAGGAVGVIAIWKNEKRNVEQVVTAAGAGGAINLGLYLWVPAIFREIWVYK
jgi:hypothetical protein